MAKKQPVIEISKPNAEGKRNVHALGANGEIVWQVTQGFRDVADAKRAIRAIRRITADAEVVVL